ncbi:uncharacterized protein LOC135387230 [Ornithodoros turicata]|uniref:uncharacterized protein LOC135387230 n=1 Tax=Ornithodoros turicata TaxID=34597 RepID=UPI00313931B6
MALINERLSKAVAVNERKYCYSVGIIHALSQLLKESASDMFATDSNAVYPTVITEDPFKFQPCQVTVEGSTYDAVDVIAAISTGFELYWVFNLKYAPSLARTFAALEHFFGLGGKKKNSILVSRLISDLA